jgi:hypothetical protein
MHRRCFALGSQGHAMKVKLGMRRQLSIYYAPVFRNLIHQRLKQIESRLWKIRAHAVGPTTI